MRNAPAHYIKPNAVARVPSRLVIFDTEAHRCRNDNKEVQTWALGVARFIHWTNKGNCQQSQSRYETAPELWSAISEFTRPKCRTVVYCHNLSYDLRISVAMYTLPHLGWHMKDIRMDSKGSWSRWVNGKASLMLCDSASIFNVPLVQIGVALGIGKPALPESSNREALFIRCEADVEILSTALLNYFGWLRTGECGNWQMTGASQAWSHWRHVHYTHKVLVHDDQEALKYERQALWTGRAEAVQWGRIFGQKLYDYDWQNAYPRIARTTELPTRLRSSITNPSPTSISRLAQRYAVLAHVRVEVNRPVVPTKCANRIVWPTGTFDTVLWDPELHLVQRYGRITHVYRAWLYRKEPILKQWGEWILDKLGDKTGEVQAWQKIVLKHWSRALIGRFAMHYRSWEQFADNPEQRCYVSQGMNLDTGDPFEMMQVGNDVYMRGEDVETNDACPQITGYIQSEARAKLWRVMDKIGEDHIFYVDTDSLLVNSAGHNTICNMVGDSDYDGLRVKRTFFGAEIYGPRSIILGGVPRVSGMPKRAVKTGEGVFKGEAWQSVERAMELGNLDCVHITGRSFRVLWNDARRIRLADGTTMPYNLRDGVIDDDGMDSIGSRISRRLHRHHSGVGDIPVQDDRWCPNASSQIRTGPGHKQLQFLGDDTT